MRDEPGCKHTPTCFPNGVFGQSAPMQNFVSKPPLILSMLTADTLSLQVKTTSFAPCPQGEWCDECKVAQNDHII